MSLLVVPVILSKARAKSAIKHWLRLTGALAVEKIGGVGQNSRQIRSKIVDNRPQARPKEDDGREPVFLLPGSVAILVLLMVVIFAAYEFALDADGKLNLLIWLGFLPVRLVDAASLPGGMLPLLWTPVTHAFLHGSWAHVLLNVAWLAIFATPVARRYGGVVMVAMFLVSSVAGALFYAVLQLNDIHILIGASGGVAGLTGAAMRFIFEPAQAVRNPGTGEVTLYAPKLAGMGEMWSNVRTRTFTFFWLGINLAIPVYDYFVAASPSQIAWQAHIGGFLFGLILPSLAERMLRRR